MLKIKNFKTRACANCGEEKTATHFNISHSPFFIDGHLPICKKCLNDAVRDCDGDWDYMNSICQWANVCFIPEKFSQLFLDDKDMAASQYLDHFEKSHFERTDWKEYEMRWKTAIKENREKDLHPIFNEEEEAKLRKMWGSVFSMSELNQLQDYYNNLKNSFGLADAISQDSAKKVSLVSLQLDKAIIANEGNVEKLVGAMDKLQKNAGFISSQATDADSFDSISELTKTLEQNGWVKKFYNQESQDIVDYTIGNIQSYLQRIVQNETTLVDQVEERKAVRDTIQEMEEAVVNAESYNDKLFSGFEAEAVEEIITKEPEDYEEEFIVEV